MTPGLLEIGDPDGSITLPLDLQVKPSGGFSRSGTGMTHSRTPKGSFLSARPSMCERGSEEWATRARMQE